MSEGDNETDDSQKTEEPTARRLEEARKRGQVVYSREVSNWAILFAATLLVVMAGPGIMADLRDTLSRFLADAGSIKTEGTSLRRLLGDLFWHVMGSIALPLLVLAAAGILSGFIQTGPIFTFDPVKPDISKISVFQGFKRLFSLRSIMEFVKGIAKLVIVSAPYQRQIVTFKNILNRQSGAHDVDVDRIVKDNAPFIMKYDPSHPAADAKGYVKMPNVNPLLEIMDMREAQRSYEANLGVIQMARSMLMHTIDLLRG